MADTVYPFGHRTNQCPFFPMNDTSQCFFVRGISLFLSTFFFRIWLFAKPFPPSSSSRALPLGDPPGPPAAATLDRMVLVLAVPWVPVAGLVQVGSQSHADRYLYIPMLGLPLCFPFFLRSFTRWALPHGGR